MVFIEVTYKAGCNVFINIFVNYLINIHRSDNCRFSESEGEIGLKRMYLYIDYLTRIEDLGSSIRPRL